MARAKLASMANASEYEFDIAVVEAVIRRLPETFDTNDVAQDPEMIAAHAALSMHRAWTSVVGLCLAKQIRGLEELAMGRHGAQMWRKTGSLRRQSMIVPANEAERGSIPPPAF
jgi:hypothetical protein